MTKNEIELANALKKYLDKQNQNLLIRGCKTHGTVNDAFSHCRDNECAPCNEWRKSLINASKNFE